LCRKTGDNAISDGVLEMIESPWHVLHVIANHEKKVAQHLSVRSVDYYLPVYTERSHWSDRTVTLERPLFVGYIFVRYSPQVRVSLISTPGVIRLLGDSNICTVSVDEINRIRRGLASGYILRPYFDLPVGTRVRVRTGIFAGAQGLVTEIRQRCKVVMTISAVSQSFTLELDRSEIDVVPPQAEKTRLDTEPSFVAP
jgi:transcriptional antiterminator NusG